MEIMALLSFYGFIVFIMIALLVIFFGSYYILKDALDITKTKYLLFILVIFVLVPILLMALISLIFGNESLVFLGEWVIESGGSN